MITISRAATDDLHDALTVLNRAARRLADRGYDQWPGGFGADRIAPLIDRGELWIARAPCTAVGTVAVSTVGDPDFWTAHELAESAVYLSKLAAAQPGNGLGELLLRWAVDHSAISGYRWVRLDAWRTNDDLHAYYLRRGWTHVRTLEVPGRRSGALFATLAEADLAARAAVTEVTMTGIDRMRAEAAAAEQRARTWQGLQLGDIVVGVSGTGERVRGQVAEIVRGEMAVTADMPVMPSRYYLLTADEGDRWVARGQIEIETVNGRPVPHLPCETGAE